MSTAAVLTVSLATLTVCGVVVLELVGTTHESSPGGGCHHEQKLGLLLLLAIALCVLGVGVEISQTEVTPLFDGLERHGSRGCQFSSDDERERSARTSLIYMYMKALSVRPIEWFIR